MYCHGLQLRGAFAALILGACSGCVSGSYRMARKDTPPAAMLNLPGVSTQQASPADPAGEAMLNTVIIHGGPGSWKRSAYWDEYVVSIANPRDVPLVIEAASLTDFQGISSAPGDDPWSLERTSRSWWSRARSGQTASLLALGAGTAVGYGAMTAVALGTMMSGGAAAGGAAAGAAAASVVALPVYAVTIVAINHRNKQAVVSEFARRRLVLPRAIAPGQVVQGSLFFRISPGPRQLVLRGIQDGGPTDIVFDLEPLTNLHMAPLHAESPPASAADLDRRSN
jgi:hypothetical protein